MVRGSDFAAIIFSALIFSAMVGTVFVSLTQTDFVNWIEQNTFNNDTSDSLTLQYAPIIADETFIYRQNDSVDVTAFFNVTSEGVVNPQYDVNWTGTLPVNIIYNQRAAGGIAYTILSSLLVIFLSIGVGSWFMRKYELM